MKIIQTAGILAALASGASQAATELVKNGGFETGDLTNWTQVGNLTIFDHIFNTSSPPTFAGGFAGGAVFEGSFALTLSNFAPGICAQCGFAGIAQSLSGTQGALYDVSVMYNAEINASNSAINVLWNGNPIIANTYSSSPAGWAGLSAQVTGTGNDVLVIEAYQDFGFNSIDKISVTSTLVPLPAPVWLLISALGGLGFAQRRDINNV